ncbi:acyloxyacyl hydrolase [Candidatus Nitrosacidococcus sp. I8]|uniref:acyloxyacyl hydrolase n=1 Tax=Candidatus Nitrosacidococcus sp. I8 TaxID=2942908 RepID=UPI002227FED2|nr:acyloxyacyl hydrolase [Candidatus Nitrosacidococcus sp. I8]CAH9018102.1 hypothetical protein NURINAE_00727 [Candidatus Nitrosacidococcus sp. I8]
MKLLLKTIILAFLSWSSFAYARAVEDTPPTMDTHSINLSDYEKRMEYSDSEDLNYEEDTQSSSSYEEDTQSSSSYEKDMKSNPRSRGEDNDLVDYVKDSDWLAKNWIKEEPSRLGFGIGSFDTVHSKMAPSAFAEWRFGKKFFGIVAPMAGILANTDGGVFGYGGIYGDYKFYNIVITPFFSVGGYSQGGSKDLGGIFNFHEGIEFAYEFDHGMTAGHRVGFRFGHISSAGINKRNPGENQIMFIYGIPLGH